MESLIAAVVGIGLAASCGFRIFAPMLVVSAANMAGYLEVAESFRWIGTWPAFIAFAVAAVVEIGAFYIPWLDHLLDTIASPIAIVAGAILFAAVTFELDPFLRWSLALIAGGGAAAVVQGGTVVTRVASTSTTGGLANFVLSTLETISGFLFSALAIIVPILAFILLLMLIATMYYIGRRVLEKLPLWSSRAAR
jgi:hypothetical protein